MSIVGKVDTMQLLQTTSRNTPTKRAKQEQEDPGQDIGISFDFVSSLCFRPLTMRGKISKLEYTVQLQA